MDSADTLRPFVGDLRLLMAGSGKVVEYELLASSCPSRAQP